MNLGNSGGGGSVSTASSSCVLKVNDGVSDQFPAGLRVLVVDDDPTCLVILEKMLRNCRYEVTTCSRAETALSRLRKNKDGFDIVISDVHMPDMDGFKLLEHIGLEMDLPVIMMSADDGKNVVMKGVTHGACDYLIKPVRIEALKNIWQHVVRKKKNEWKDLDQSGSMDDGDGLQKPLEDADYSSSANEGSWRSSKKRKDDEDELEDRDDTSTLKKPRVVWSVELHQQFVAAVNQLGIDKAVPKRILELMNVPGLTRENVASHLQKYRLYLRRLSGVSQHQGGLNNSFMGVEDASFRAMSSLNGVDLQALAVAGQIPPQSLASFQAAGLGRSTPKSVLPMSMVDQRNLFSFENPKMRYGDIQSQQQNSGNKQMNLLHGIPTTMEPKQLANLHQSAQAFGAMNMQVQPHVNQGSPLLMHMAQPQPRGPGYISVSQSSSIRDFPINQTAELPGISFPIGSTPTPKGVFQDSHGKGPRGFLPSYDIFDELQQHKSPNWDSQRGGLAFDASQHSNPMQGHMHVTPLVLVHQGVSSTQKSLQNSYPSKVSGNGEGSEQRKSRNVGQSTNNTQFGDNSSRVKTETITQGNLDTTFFSQQYGQPQDDLLSALLKQVSFSFVCARACVCVRERDMVLWLKMRLNAYVTPRTRKKCMQMCIICIINESRCTFFTFRRCHTRVYNKPSNEHNFEW